jgi:hypothetical protein
MTKIGYKKQRFFVRYFNFKFQNQFWNSNYLSNFQRMKLFSVVLVLIFALNASMFTNSAKIVEVRAAASEAEPSVKKVNDAPMVQLNEQVNATGSNEKPQTESRIKKHQ